MRFDKCKHLCNDHATQDAELFHLLSVVPHASQSPCPTQPRICSHCRSVLLVDSFSFRITEERKHTLYSFMSDFFNQQNAFVIHSCCCMYQELMSFCFWGIFRKLDVPQFVSSFSCWTLGLFPVWGYSQKKLRCEQVSLMWTYVFVSVGEMCRSGIARWFGKCVFTFIRTAQLFSKVVVPFCFSNHNVSEVVASVFTCSC